MLIIFYKYFGFTNNHRLWLPPAGWIWAGMRRLETQIEDKTVWLVLNKYLCYTMYFTILSIIK